MINIARFLRRPIIEAHLVTYGSSLKNFLKSLTAKGSKATAQRIARMQA